MQPTNTCTFYRLLYASFFILFLISLVSVGYLVFSRTERNILEHQPLYSHLARARHRTDQSTGASTYKVSSSTQAAPTDSSTTGYLSSTGAPKLSEQTRKPHVILVVNILTAPSRLDRRDGVRATWLKECSGPEVVCNFFTDPLSELDANETNAISNESRAHDDLKFMSVPRGYNFGRRILWLTEWSMQNYDFDFLLRVDDDYFVCLKKLLLELPHRLKTKRVNWGYLHCSQYGTRIDEGFMIFSAALALEFLRQKESLLCGPYGGTTVGVWLNNVTNVTLFHDSRLFHGVSAGSAAFKNPVEICQTWLGIHGSYPAQMLQYWSIVSKETVDKYDIPPIKPRKEVCRYEGYYNWRKDGGTEPILCRLNPVFHKGKMHKGRGK